ALTRQLLAFGRKQVLYPRVLDLNGVVRGLARMLERLIVDDVTLHLDLAPALDAVSADPGQLEQVLMNLALNARDAMPHGGVLTVRTRATTVPDGPMGAPLPPGRYVTLEVCDEGVGMDAATLARAFEPFFTTKRPGAGTGLGLATVHGIVRQSGGDVRIESRPRHGTMVTVLLPAARQPAQPETSTDSSVAMRGGRTVLLVDDDEAVRRSLERMLARFGYRVLAAADAESALRVAAGHDGDIDVLLTDIVMPGLSGPALAERLAVLRPETRVLFISGYEEVARAQTGLAHGAPLLRKPFAGAALAERLKTLLEQ
ncbi:MAG TPA: ATP-binding protein, partial [Gemmatimonadaceae bacterium]|nr:ATP-binding protein [Gemmatimonadaceae bacterium]